MRAKLAVCSSPNDTGGNAIRLDGECRRHRRHVHLCLHRHLRADNATLAAARAGFVASLAGYGAEIPFIFLGGRLSDRYGHKSVNAWGNLPLLLGIYSAFVWAISTRSVAALIWAMVILNAAYSLRMSSFYAAFIESLPPQIRSGGFGTVHAASVATFGGTTQLVVTGIIRRTGSAVAPAGYLIRFTSSGPIAYMLYRETAPVRLRSRRQVLPVPQISRQFHSYASSHGAGGAGPRGMKNY